MAEGVCIFFENDGQLLAKYLQEKLNSKEMAIKTNINVIYEYQSAEPFKVNVFLISPEFLSTTSLKTIQDFEKTRSILVLASTDFSELEEAVVENGIEPLLEWFVYSLEESDNSVKELLVSIISLYEDCLLFDDTSESEMEEKSENTWDGDNNGEIEYSGKNPEENICEDDEHYKVLPERSSTFLNAVKYVFRKDGHIYLLLDNLASGNINVVFHEDGNIVNPTFIRNVCCYSFPWSGLRQETFNISFEQEEYGNGIIDAVPNAVSKRRNDHVVSEAYKGCSAWSSVPSGIFLKDEESPYDVLPFRDSNWVPSLHSISDSNEIPDEYLAQKEGSAQDKSENIESDATSDNEVGLHCGVLQTESTPHLEEGFSSLKFRESRQVDYDELNRCSDASGLSKTLSREVSQEDQKESYDITSLRETASATKGSLSSNPSTETLVETRASSHITDSLQEYEENFSEVCSPMTTQSKLERLRTLLEEETRYVSSLPCPLSETDDVQLRDRKLSSSGLPTQKDKNDSFATTDDTNLVCWTKEEETLRGTSTLLETISDSEEESISSRLSDEATFDQSEEETSRGTSAIIETICDSEEESISSRISKGASFVDKSDEIKQFTCDENANATGAINLSPSQSQGIIDRCYETTNKDYKTPAAKSVDQNGQKEPKPGRKTTFSFKHHIKKMIQRSQSEPKLRLVVEAVQKSQKTKVCKSKSNSAATDALSRSVSSGQLPDLRESMSEKTYDIDESSKKKKKINKALQRTPSLRIQRVLRDENLCAPALPMRTFKEKF